MNIAIDSPNNEQENACESTRKTKYKNQNIDVQKINYHNIVLATDQN
jgi:hypothetical protein